MVHVVHIVRMATMVEGTFSCAGAEIVTVAAIGSGIWIVADGLTRDWDSGLAVIPFIRAAFYILRIRYIPIPIIPIRRIHHRRT